tara:strand:- start:45278 stop:45808 length:531 start_codon:yes stop_codon:yes gene_type:complete
MEEQIKLNDNSYLKFITLSEAQSIFELIQLHKDYLNEFLHWPRLTNKLEDSENFIQATIKNRKKHIYVYGIYWEDKIVGVTGFNDFNKQNRFASIGYWLAPSHQGKGLMHTSLKILMKKMQEEFDVRRFEIRCAVENLASAAVAEKLGFNLEGILKSAEVVGERTYDHKLFALICE